MHDLHPTPETLAAYCQGRLDEQVEREVEEHLHVCDSCCDNVNAMPDSIVDVLHGQEAGLADDGYRFLSDEEDDVYADDWESESGLVIDDEITGDYGILPDLERPPEITVGIREDDTATADETPDSIPEELANHPRYRIIEQLGSGGMGKVYKAEHRMMQRVVALKVINESLIGHPDAVERFHREVQAAAKLSHPNIVTAYDAEQAGRLHFLVMEYIDGEDLNRVTKDRGPLPVNEACRYLREAAFGLQHAHDQGMVHRDIKPHNLMLSVPQPASLSAGEPETSADRRAARATVKILDFGLASLATEVIEDLDDSEHAGDSRLTRCGAMMGTPEFIAPEQARDAHSADIRSDIYGLGCTLFSLLTGRAPFTGDSVTDTVLAHSHNDVPKVSDVRDDIPESLEIVIQRMLAKSPDDRFQTPSEVVTALEPFVEEAGVSVQHAQGEEQKAEDAGRKPTPQEEPEPDTSVRWAFGCIAVAALTIVGVVAAIGMVISMVTDYGRVVIESEVDDVDVVVTQGGKEIAVVDLQTGSNARWLSSGEYKIALKGDRNDVELTRDGFAISRLGKQIVRVRRIDTAVDRPASHGEPMVITKPLRKLTGHTAIVRGLDISPDGKQLISASWDGSARLWDLQTGKLLHLFHLEPRVNDARFSLGGRKVILAENTTVRVYDAESHERLPLQFKHPQPLTKLEFSRDHRRMLTGCLDATMRLWDTQTGELLKTFGGHKKSLEAVLFTADETEVLSGNLDTTVRRFATDSGRLQAWYPHPGMVLSMCSSPSGQVVYVGCGRGAIMAWDFKTGQIIKQFRGHQGEVLRLATHGRMLVSAGSDRTARVWDVASGRELARLVDHQDRIDALAISPDGRLIVTGGGFHPVSKATWEKPDYVIRVWEITPPPTDVTLNRNAPASQPDNSWIDIFDGRSLDGWETDGDAAWTIENGILIGRGRHGHGRLLYRRQAFEDVEVRAECKTNPAGNSGVFVRTQPGSHFDNGYEAQITNREDQATWTGGIWPQTRFKKKLVEDDTWFTLEVRAVGNVISVKVNGQQTSQFTDDRRQFRSGLVGLQAWGKATVVSLRRIQVRQLESLKQRQE